MTTLIILVSVVLLALAALWGYAYWHQTKALKAEMERLCAAKPGHWKPGEPNPVRGIEYQRREDGTFEAVPVPYPTPTVGEQAREIWERQSGADVDPDDAKADRIIRWLCSPVPLRSTSDALRETLSAARSEREQRK